MGLLHSIPLGSIVPAPRTVIDYAKPPKLHALVREKCAGCVTSVTQRPCFHTIGCVLTGR